MASGAKPDGESATGEVDADQDDVKRKFREALERKKGNAGAGAGADETGEHAKVHGAHGPAHTQRQFRRKSGG